MAAVIIKLINNKKLMTRIKAKLFALSATNFQKSNLGGALMRHISFNDIFNW